MQFTSPHQFKFSELHNYPSGTQHLYLFSPEKVNFLDMDVVERTFIKENKLFWGNVVGGNIKELRCLKGRLKSLRLTIKSQGSEASESQIEYQQELQAGIKKQGEAIRIALKRKLNGFAFKKTEIKEATALIAFFQALRVICSDSENAVCKGNIVEDALGIFQKEVFFEEPTKSKCGAENEILLKRIISHINCSDDDRYFYMTRIVSLKVSDRLALLGKSSRCLMPSYPMR
jgi:hypothetical protein